MRIVILMGIVEPAGRFTMGGVMRTTLDIEDDVLLAAREIARHQGRSMGKVLSDLARQALTQPIITETRNGIPILPVQPGAGIVTIELVNQLRDEEP